MFKNNIIKKLIASVFAMMVLAGGIRTVAYAASAPDENRTIIRIGSGGMSRGEFDEWRVRRGIRFFSIEGRIYPAGIFFGFSLAQGKSFSYGELTGETLHVALLPNADGGSSNGPAQERLYEQQTSGNTQAGSGYSPVIFGSPVPVMFSDAELTSMIESAPLQNALDAISAISLTNRRLVQAELAAWIDEYNEMGGATAFELGVVREVNRVRAHYGLRPLALDPALMMSARLKTQEFGDLQYFAHNSPVHGSITDAARMFGFEGRWASEAITRTGNNAEVHILRTTPERIVGGMLASTRGHREILLNPDALTVGFGSFYSPNSTGAGGNMTHMFYHATKFGF